MLPSCCLEPWHVNQDLVSRTAGHRKEPWSWSMHFCWLLPLWLQVRNYLGMSARGVTMAFFCVAGTGPNSPSSLPESPISPSISGPWVDECTICYENVVDTVIYSCGHMCLCYSCGLKLKKMANACCPICRRAIKDIIKTYRST